MSDLYAVLIAEADEYVVIRHGVEFYLRESVNELIEGQNRYERKDPSISDEAWHKLYEDLEEDSTSCEMYTFRILYCTGMYVETDRIKLEVSGSPYNPGKIEILP